MDHRLQQMTALLAELHRVAGLGLERRRAVIERILRPLGESLGASVGLILWQDCWQPVVLGSDAIWAQADDYLQSPSGRGERDRGVDGQPGIAGDARATWWVRWAEPLGALPPDGIVRRGWLLSEPPRVVAEPSGWPVGGPTLGAGKDKTAGTGVTEGKRPVLGVGLTFDGLPVRLVFLREPNESAFGAPEHELMASVADHLSVCGRTAMRLGILKRETITDELTGVFNYRYLKRTLRSAMRRLRSRGGVLSVLMIDVDHLREYNNRFGHLKASAVLAKVGNVLGRSLGNVGWIAKYGGDEFLVVLPRTGREDAIRAAHNLRLAIEGADTGNAAFGTMTCSFGVATAPEDGNTFVDLLDAADRALFQAKAQGRNTVVAATHKRSRRSTRRRRAA